MAFITPPKQRPATIPRRNGPTHSKRFLRLLLAAVIFLPAFLGACQQAAQPPAPESLPTPTAAPPEGQVEYRNPEYGFSLSLPPSWQGFSVRTDVWEGLNVGERGDEVVATGTLIAIVHPDVTAQTPRQDIPIMVFTMAQWEALQRDEWHIGAAPIGPVELGRNSRYVLALPARYNYAFPEGWEEVEQILQGQPLSTFEPA